MVSAFVAALLCSVGWVYGGFKKGRAIVIGPEPLVSVRPGVSRLVINDTAEMAALDAGTRSPWTGDDRQQAQALFARLKERGIAVQPTLYKLLGMATSPQRSRLLSHCQVFFTNVDTQEVSNTGCLTSMLKNKRQVCSFLSHSDDSVRRVARTPALRSLTSLFNSQGFPQAEEDTQAFMEWEIWWQKNGESHTLDRELLRIFSSMFRGRRLPNKKAVDEYFQWQIWQQGDGEVRTLDRELLRAFASMFHGKGLPDKNAVDNYLNWELWWQGQGNARTLDRKLLRNFSSMFHSKGLPDKKAVDNYLKCKLWWQGEGNGRTLDRELLRIFSSMFNSRGLPDPKTVEDYLRWEIWQQGEGETRTLDRGLLRTFASMLHGKGLPDKKTVDNYLQWDLWWQGQGSARTLDRELLRTFSSMFNCRGLPGKKAVDNYLKYELWWQREGDTRTLDRQLLRVFSSMFNGRGLPDKKAVEDYLQWDIWWQGEGEARSLDRTLLRTFSSMFSGKGLPDKKAVDDYVAWEFWWQKKGDVRILDRELLRAFSSMCNGKKIPEKKAVQEYLQLDIWWQSKGGVRTLDRKLLHAFSSMFSGRGLPDKQAVADYMQRDIWWQSEGEARTLDQELLRIFSSMFNGSGFPDKKAVDDYLASDIWWQGEGEVRTLDRELLRIFSSMFNGRKLPDKKAVEEYLQLDVWWQGEGQARTLDRELLRVFSSMFNSRGLPDKKAVEDYLQWEFWWQGEGEARTLNRELLRAFSSMFHGRGLPEKHPTDEVLQWLTWSGQLDEPAIKLMASLWSGAYTGHKPLGLPDINKLRQAEQKLATLVFPTREAFYRDEQNVPQQLIKMVALYLANDGGARQLRWIDCEAWLRVHPGALSKKSLLSRLLLVLHYHGGRGVKEAVTLISGQPAAAQWFVLDALVSGKALATVQYALRAIEPTDWEDYLFFTGELHPRLSDRKWTTIKSYLQALDPVLSDREYRRRFLTLIWPLSPNDRERFMQPEAVPVLAILLPRVQVIRDLLAFLSTDELRILCDTCLTYRAGQPDRQGLPTLFKALLLAQLPLLDHGAIPDDLLAQTLDDPEGVVIGGSPTIGVEAPVTLFIQVMTAFMQRLWESQYAINGSTLTLWPRGETVPITFPLPSLVWHPDGVQIRHWTSAHLHRFCQATECLQVHRRYRQPANANDHEPGAAASPSATAHD